jgi:hypothetical protein
MPKNAFVEQESKPLPKKTVQAPQRTEQIPQKIVEAPQKASLAALKTSEFGAKVFLHTSREGNRSILEEIGDAPRRPDHRCLSSARGCSIDSRRLSTLQPAERR